MSSVIFGPWFRVASANPTLPKIIDDHRYAARSLATAPRGEARLASGSATTQNYTTTGDTTRSAILHLGGLSFRERSWTADEWTAPNIKSQEAVRIPRNADPDALPDFAGVVVAGSEP
jgi:hypothetical protein